VIFSALDKRLEDSITTADKAQAIAQFKADKPWPNRRGKPNDKPEEPDKNKTKLKDRKGDRTVPSSDKNLHVPITCLTHSHTAYSTTMALFAASSEKAYKKSEADKEEDGVGRITDFCTSDSSYICVIACGETNKREKISARADKS
jgi:hypothetical protein